MNLYRYIDDYTLQKSEGKLLYGHVNLLSNKYYLPHIQKDINLRTLFDFYLSQHNFTLATEEQPPKHYIYNVLANFNIDTASKNAQINTWTVDNFIKKLNIKQIKDEEHKNIIDMLDSKDSDINLLAKTLILKIYSYNQLMAIHHASKCIYPFTKIHYSKNQCIGRLLSYNKIFGGTPSPIRLILSLCFDCMYGVNYENID